MSRIGFDSEKYHKLKGEMRFDGIHCVICRKTLPPHKRKYCSEECQMAFISSIPSWQIVRSQALKRDKNLCQKCGKYGYEVHHRRPICEGGDEFDLDNCVTLCYECHKHIHSVTGKREKQNRSLNEF